MFFGEYNHTIDAKGRLFIPVKLREGLGESFMVSKGMDRCLCLYPNDEWEKFLAVLASLPSVKSRNSMRFFNAGAKEDALDAQGRIALNQKHREYAQLEKNVVIIGNRTHIEIWDEQAWIKQSELLDNELIIKELIELGL